ncbi:porin (plasmid) [Burkholderia sp. SFA1]|nr:porin [Burkholderia sp. SFA1]
MKKILGGLAAAGWLVCSSAAQAQTSVTLYGIVDVGVTYVSNTRAGRVFAMQSGFLQGSRFGLTGREDLGGGTTVIFTLENGFDAFSGRLGQGGRGFGRQSFVGLSRAGLGTLTIGRQYDPFVNFVGPGTMNGTYGGQFAHAGDVDNTNNSFRVDNSIKFTSANLGGVSFGSLYAMGGVAGQFGARSMISLGGSYSNGPLYLGAGYFFAKNPVQEFPDGNFVSSNAIFGTAVVGAQTASQQVAGLTGAYTIGNVKTSIAYTNTRFKDTNGAGADVTFNNYEIWASYFLKPSITIATGYTYSMGTIDATQKRPKYHQFNVFGDYLFSKRTDLYAMLAYQIAAGDATNAQINPGIAAAATGTRQFVFHVGMRHRF